MNQLEESRAREEQLREDKFKYDAIQRSNDEVYKKLMEENKLRAQQAEAQRRAQISELQNAERQRQAEARQLDKEIERRAKEQQRAAEQKAREEKRAAEQRAREVARIEKEYARASIADQRAEEKLQRDIQRAEDRDFMNETYDFAREASYRADDLALEIRAMKQEILDLRAQVGIAQSQTQASTVLNYVPK